MGGEGRLGMLVVAENLVGTIAWVCLFPCQGFIDRVRSPIAWAAFDLPGRNWGWDFGGREGREEVSEESGM